MVLTQHANLEVTVSGCLATVSQARAVARWVPGTNGPAVLSKVARVILEVARSQGKAVLGEDFSMALGGGADADEANFFDRGWR